MPELERRHCQVLQALDHNLPGEMVLERLSRYMCFLSSQARSAAFISIAKRLRADLFWRAFHREWSSFDLIDHIEFERLLLEYRSEWNSGFMPAPDAEGWESLAGEIQVYRGQCSTKPVGLSWTTDPSIAEGFARGHRGIKNRSPVICSAVVKKVDIASIQTDRNESEIVLFETAAARARKVQKMTVGT